MKIVAFAFQKWLAAACCALFALAGGAQANAQTSVFDATLGALGASAPSGPLVSLGLGESVRINFSSRFAVNNSDVLSLTFASPGLRYDIRAGQTSNSGSTIVFNQQGLDTSSSPVSFFSLATRGCLGGCDFIELQVTGSNFGAPPLVVSAVGLAGNFGGGPTAFVTSLAPVSSAPEPHVWLLMILGFIAVALRLKQARGPMSAPLLAMPLLAAPQPIALLAPPPVYKSLPAPVR